MCDSIHWNLPAAALYEEAVRRSEGMIAPHRPAGGAHRPVHRPLAQRQVRGPRAGQREPDLVGRGQPAVRRRRSSRALHERMLDYIAEQDVFVQDLFVGADPEYRLSVRVITESAWANLFARNLFIRPSRDELESFEPNFTVINMPSFQADPASATARAPRRSSSSTWPKRLILIGGTAYAGEIKKSMFTVMNYYLPLRRRVADALLGQHRRGRATWPSSSASRAPARRPSRPTRSRTLIGDDEHGWSDQRRLQLRGRLLRQGDQPVASRPSRPSGAPATPSARSSKTW